MKASRVCILAATLWAATLCADDNNGELARRLAAMEQQLQAQQVEIQDLRQQLQAQQATQTQSLDQVRQDVAASLAAQGYAAEGGGSGVKLGPGTRSLTLKGDLRLRAESRRYDNFSTGVGQSDESNDRFRTRFRLGGVWTGAEGWEVGAGLITGDPGARNTNNTWSSTGPFGKGDLLLDYAYVAHNFGKTFALTVGQQENPFKTSALMWDSAVRPAGATAQLKLEPFFVTGGAYVLREDNASTTSQKYDAALYAAQAGFNGEVLSGFKGTLAVGYYGFDHNATQVNDSSASAVPPYESDYRFHVADLYANLSGSFGGFEITPFGHYWKNLGVEDLTGLTQYGGPGQAGINAGDGDTGWAAGLGTKIQGFNVEYAYGYVGSDSFPGYLRDSTFGSTAGLYDTDVKGHKIGLGYDFSKYFSLGLAAYFLQSIDDSNDLSSTLYQLDATYKF